VKRVSRRALLGSLAYAAAKLKAQAPGSLYIPKAHVVEDRKFLHDFMDEFSFADLITATPTLRITHIPTFIDRSKGKFGTIFGHVSKQNPQQQTFDGAHDAVIVFRGPHGYISPTWYTKTDVVPTWNFAVVHVSGKLRAVSDRKPLHDLLAKLIDKNENYLNSGYSFAKLSDDYKFGLMAGIVGFEMEIEAIEGKFKLGQERSAGDKQGVLKNLKSAKRERSLYELTESFYERG
jgi:transcriptional regulator